jgi:uncharacterized protein Yka (UPF0111/DUF47 family)
MISLKRIFGQDDTFYNLLESSATEAKNSASLLMKLLKSDAPATVQTDLAQSRRKHKQITQRIRELLCKTFVTPLEREDIDALSTALYKIPKNVEKIGERLQFFPDILKMETVAKQAALLESAIDAVSSMVKKLHAHNHAESISDTYEQLQAIEGDADKLMTKVLYDLYHGHIQVREMVVLKDIYELLERTIDRCRDAGNVVFQVVLKYS